MALGSINVVYIALFIFCIVELSLSIYLNHANYSIFFLGELGLIITPLMISNSVWNLLVIAYLAITSLYLTRFYHALTAFVLCVITTIIGLAIFIGMVYAGFNPKCGKSNPDDVFHFLYTYCQCMTAAEAFSCIIWAIFMVLTVLKGLSMFRRRRTHAIPLP